MKARVLVSLLILCALTLGAYFLIPALTKKNNTNDTPNEPVYEVLVDVSDKEKIVYLSFEKNDGVRYEIERIQSGWQSAGRPGLRIDGAEIDPLLENLRVVSAVSRIASDDPSEFLLDDPAMILREKLSGGIEKRFEIGFLNQSKGAYYVRLLTTDPDAYSASGTIWLISKEWVNSFDRSLETLLWRDSLPDFSSVAAVTGAESVDSDTLLGCLEGLRLSERVDFGAERYAIFGMDDPLMLRISSKDSEHVLYFSSDEQSVHLYVRIDDSESIYLLRDDSGVIRSLLR